MQKLIFKLLITLSICFSLSAQAIPVLLKHDGVYYGAEGIKINGSIYNVEFVDGAFIDVFNGFGIPFNNESEVILASSVLHTLISADSVLSWNPSLTSGCSSYECYILSPIASYDNEGSYTFGERNPLHSWVKSAISYNGEGVGPDIDYETWGNSYLPADFTDWESFVWARWTFSSTDVPESSSIAILFIGSILLCLRRFIRR